MKWKLALLIIISTLIVSCGSQELPFPAGGSEAEQLIPTTISAGDSSSSESITEDAGGYARAFYRAWEDQDYIGMYSLLAP